MSMIELNSMEIPQGMPLVYVKELLDLNLEKLQYSLFLCDRSITNTKAQQKVFYKAMQSMATKDPAFCFKMGQLNNAADKEIEGHVLTKKQTEEIIERINKVKEEINNV